MNDVKLTELGEFGLIRRIKELVHSESPGIVTGIADDAAVLQMGEGLLLLSTDAFVEGVHFDLQDIEFDALGWRLLAANLSDIAAMGGVPRFVVVSAAFRADLPVAAIDDFYRGMNDLAQQYNVAIVGGDTTRTPDRMFFSLAVAGDGEPDLVRRRSGARVGDVVLVTGDLGGSKAGLAVLKTRQAALKRTYATVVEKHLKPVPRVVEARYVVENFAVHAMIDISDGLATETQHICTNSGMGARLFAPKIPLHPETRRIARMFSTEALDYALYGGEDFELLLTVPADAGEAIVRALRKNYGVACTPVGVIVPQKEGLTLEKNGHSYPLSAGGFDHFAAVEK